MEAIKIVVPAHALSEIRYVQKVGKYIATIQFHGHPQMEFWVSEKQAKALDRAFPDGEYSTKTGQAYVALEHGERGYRFIWAALNEANAREMAERFGCQWGWDDVPAE